MTELTKRIHHYFINPSGDAERIFHGRGRMYPGLDHITIDIYPPVVLVTLFAPPQAELVDEIRTILHQYNQVEALVIQRRYIDKSPSEVVYGIIPNDHIVSERGAKYSITLGQSQNSGLFLDMSEGRKWLNANAYGKRILNLFSFTCSLSVAALKGGATHSVNFDMSKGVLNTGRLNHRINGMNMNNVEFFAYDILKSWGRIKKKGPYDIVIIDPPSFQKGSFVATKDYTKVVRRIADLINPGGIVIASLNSPELGTHFIKDIFSKECPQSQFVTRIENPDTFPDTDSECSLKLMLFSL